MDNGAIGSAEDAGLSDDQTIAIIAGAAGGSCVLVLLIAIGCVLVRKRKKRQKSASESVPTGIGSAADVSMASAREQSGQHYDTVPRANAESGQYEMGDISPQSNRAESGQYDMGTISAFQ